MILSVSLAIVNYQHWDGYRVFVASLKPQLAGKRVWIDSEWGLRYYLEAEGGLVIRREQALRVGDIVVTSEPGLSGPLHHERWRAFADRPARRSSSERCCYG